jgi:AcrR family transcriptional regulator
MPSPAYRSRSARRSSRDLILEAATLLFYRSGFRAVAVDDIAARSGVTKTTLYRYFVSKDELAAVCLGKLAADHLTHLAAIGEQFPNDALAQLRAIVAEAASRMRHPSYCGWLHSKAEVEISDEDHPLRQVCQVYKARLRDHLVRTAKQAGCRNPTSLGEGLLLLLEGAGASWRCLGHEAAADGLKFNSELLIAGHC